MENEKKPSARAIAYYFLIKDEKMTLSQVPDIALRLEVKSLIESEKPIAK